MELSKLDPERLRSPFADQLKRGFGTLRFSTLLEREFRDFYIAQTLPRARLSGLIALVLVLAVACVDFLFSTPVGESLNPIRLGVLCPLLALIGVCISLPSARRWYNEVRTEERRVGIECRS